MLWCLSFWLLSRNFWLYHRLLGRNFRFEWNFRLFCLYFRFRLYLRLFLYFRFLKKLCFWLLGRNFRLSLRLWCLGFWLRTVYGSTHKLCKSSLESLDLGLSICRLCDSHACVLRARLFHFFEEFSFIYRPLSLYLWLFLVLFFWFRSAMLRPVFIDFL